MPRIGLYDPGQVQGDGGVSARVSVDAPSGAFGVDPGAVAAVGQGLDTAGKYLQAWNDQQDEARVMQISRPAAITYRNALYGAPDGSTVGFLSLKGVDALNARQGVEQQLQQARSDAMGQAQNPRQRALLQQKLDSDYNAAANQIASHYAQQGQVYAEGETAAQGNLERDNFVSTFPFDPSAAAPHLAAAEAFVRRTAHSGGPAAEDLAVQGLRTKAYGAVIDNYLAQGTADAIHKADGVFQTTQGFMDPDSRAAYAAKVQAQVTQQGAADAATAALAHTAVMASAPVPTGSVPSQNRSLVAQAGGTADEQSGLALIGQIENPGGQNIKNPLPGVTSYGRWQINDATWKALGGTAQDRGDPQRQAELALKLYRQNASGLASAIGRAPSAMESYLAWQQGLGATTALLRADPGALAVQVLKDAHVANATDAIVNNLPASLKPASGNTTVGQFLSSWGARVNGAAANVAATPGVSPALNPTTGAWSAGVPNEAAFVADAVSRAPPGASAQVVQQYRSAAQSAYANLTQAHSANDQAQEQLVASVLLNPAYKSLSDVPGSIKAQLDPTHLLRLSDKYGDGKNFAQEDDPQTVADLSQLYSANDRRLLGVNMADLAGKVTSGTFQKVLGWQRDLENPTAEKLAHQTTLRAAMQTASRQLTAAGITERNNPKGVAQFQTALQGSMDAWRQANPGKEPDERVITNITDTLLLNGRWTGQGVFGPSTITGPRYMAPQGEAVTTVVPDSFQRQIRAAYAARRLPEPSYRDMAVAYQQAHAYGLVK